VTMRVRDLTPADLDDIAGWRYDDRWAVYDSDGPLDPELGYWAVVEGSRETERLVGFGCLGEDARVPGLPEADGVLDVGVGMRPDLVGQGRGPELATTVLDFAHARGATRLRAVVQDWNIRSLRLVERLGFVRVGTHDVGEVTFVVVERETS
jgi:ribosomal-protein-alanine N-acetyltransferase